MSPPAFYATWTPTPVVFNCSTGLGVRVVMERHGPGPGPTVQMFSVAETTFCAPGHPVEQDPVEAAFNEATARAQRWGGRLERFSQTEECAA